MQCALRKEMKMLKNTEQRYGNLSIGLHWLTLLLMVAVYGLMEFRDIFP